VTRPDRLTRDDYQAAMASLDWQDRRRIELSSRRGVTFDDPTYAALAAERAHRLSVRTYWVLISGPIAAALLWSGLDVGSSVRVWFAGIFAVIFAFAMGLLATYHSARTRHLATADFEALREIAQQHRFTYRRRY
jgi:hypothetical protein